jgi:Domain of unknown function (DUF5610)
MTISNITSPTHTPASTVDNKTPRAEPSHGDQVSALARNRAQLNAGILMATEAQLRVKDHPLALVLRSAIEAINERLEATFGPNAIESAVDSGLDISPQATADRIVGLSTAFFQAFSEQNPNEEGEELVNHFLNVIGSGIEQGFSEAREILDGLGVLEGEIADNINQTYELVQQGLESFRESQLAE